MAKRLYVGNLAFSVTSLDLRTRFAEFGTVEAAQVQMNRETGRSRGFGFVVMTVDAEADQAIAQVDGTELGGRRLNVNEAQPKAPPPADRGRSQSRAGRRD